MRAIWKGAVAFGLVSVPVKLYAATGEQSVSLNQVHREDGGRIRYRKVCSACGEEVAAADIAKGYQTDDGRMVVLTDEDFDALPLSTEREIAVLEFVPSDQVDPIMLAKTYYLEPEKTAAKPYALLREALAATDRMAVVKVALRQRESMAVLRVRDDVICLQTLLWPDEIRAADFPVLQADVAVRPQELQMASSLIESLAGDFDPSEFEDSYRTALESLLEAKMSAGGAVQVPTAESDDDASGGGEVVDLLSALQRSVEKARGARAGGSSTGTDERDATEEPEPAAKSSAPAARRTSTTKRAATTKKATPTAKKASAKAAPAKAAPAKKTTARKAPAKASSDDVAAKTTATKEPAKRATARRRAS